MTRTAKFLARALLGLVLVLLTLPALAQEGPAISPEQKSEVLARMTQLITRSAFVPGVDFSKWEKFIEEEKGEIDEAKDVDSFNTAVNKALRNFGFSHIVLMSPQATRARMNRSVVGIGVTIQPEEAGFRVVKTVPGEPAAGAGIVPGDLLVEADGKKLSATTQITGEEGTEVAIKVRKEDGTEKVVTVKRHKYSTVSPETLTWVGDDAAVLKINTFDLSYDRELVEKHMEAAAKAKYLVLDLRSNGGGAVVNMNHLLSLLLPTSTPIGTFVTRTTVTRYVEDTKGDPNDVVAIAKWSEAKLRTMKAKVAPFAGKIAVLVNEGSGSASEIAAAALNETLKSPVVGHPSAGAVLASIMVPLPGGFMLQYPITDYVTLGGVRLEGTGVKPEALVDTPRFNEKDLAIDKALGLLKKGT